MKKLLLALLMVLALSVSAWAATSITTLTVKSDADEYGNFEYETLIEALEAVRDGPIVDDDDEDAPDPEPLAEAIIILEDDVDLDEDTITLDTDEYPDLKTLTIVGGGHRLTGAGSARYFVINNPALTFTLQNIRLDGEGKAGGVLVQDGSFVAENVTFNRLDATDLESDEETDSAGGAVRVMQHGSATLTSCTFTDNTATTGGAVQVDAGTATFTGANAFSGNTATNGGVLYVASGAVVTFSGTPTFESNTATSDGGAIYSLGTLSFTEEGSFTSNTASANGGAISITNGEVSLTGVTFGGSVSTRQNRAANGGAISITGGNLTINSSSFLINSADVYGGAIYASGTVTLGTGNNFSGSKAVDGGAIYLPDSSSAQLIITGDTTLSSNTAKQNGGAIAAERNSKFTFTGSVTIDGNDATNGGGLWIRAGSQLSGITSAVSFTNNTADYGGGLYVAIENTSTVSLNTSTNFTFEGNSATYYGGAIYTVRADVNISGITIDTRNSVGFAGGFVWSGGGVTVSNATISGQSAQWGGAIYALGDVVIENSSLTNNIANPEDGSDFGGGGAIYALGSVTVNSSDLSGNRSITNNTDQGGGAIFLSGDATITGSTFSNNTHTNNANVDNGGGAIYVNRGSLTITGSRFISNGATGTGGSRGGAIYANTAVINITDSYFSTNRAVNNGGALVFAGSCVSRLENVSFIENVSSGAFGGAVYAQGSLTLTSCYLYGNRSGQSGGAVYFNQHNNPNAPGAFTAESTLFRSNNAGSAPLNGQGGAVYLHADVVTINRCTFDTNQAATTNADSRGGAVYVDTNEGASATVSSIKNSAFYNNQVYGGSTNYGGGVYMTGEVSVISCAFTKNAAIERGGAIFVGNGTLTITATILAGNTADNGRDIYSEGNITSRGYNRVGVYGKGGTDTSWLADITTSTTDRENSAWNTTTFWGEDAELLESDTYYTAPKVGCSLLDTVYLVALVLNEIDSLAESDRATNAIPFARRFTLNIDQYDIWGVNRFGSGNDISCGPHYYGGSGGNGGGVPPEAYDIASITMSGIPNSLKNPGHTASLVAVIHYVNGRVAYGVPYDKAKVALNSEERVTWISSMPNFVTVDKNGNITALRATINSTGARITVKTVRQTPAGTQAEASRNVIITEDSSYMNISPTYWNYLADYVDTLLEHDISVAIADVDSSTVSNTTFRRNFTASWSTTPTQITELTTSTPTFDTYKTYRSNDGLTASKNAAVHINFPNRTAGDLFPLVYSWSFTGSELQAITGSDLTGHSITQTLADTLFEKLRIDYQGSSNSWPVVGGSGVKASDAMNAGALTLTQSDGGKGVRIELTAYLANVKTTGNSDGPQLVRGTGTKQLLVVPDGVDDGAITGTMWMLQPSSTTTPDNSGNSGNSGNTTPNTNANDNGGGGGGGCDSAGVGLIALLLLLKRKR